MTPGGGSNQRPVAAADRALALGRRDEAIEHLFEACREPDWDVPFLAVSPRFDDLRDHPRWSGIPCLVPGRERAE